jgi:hypothetical protein
MVNAMSSLRCFAESAGIPDTKPIHVEENGYPTSDSPDRSEQRQVDVMRNLVGAVNDFRGTYDVSDYRWFNLRDGDSSSPNFQQRYGLLHDDYTEKPAFGVYRDLVARLSARGAIPAESSSGPVRTPRLHVRCVRHGWRASLVNPPPTPWVDFLLDGRRARRDRRAPYRATLLSRRARRRTRLHEVTARTPGGVRLSQRVHGCRRTATHVSSAG